MQALDTKAVRALLGNKEVEPTMPPRPLPGTAEYEARAIECLRRQLETAVGEGRREKLALRIEAHEHNLALIAMGKHEK